MKKTKSYHQQNMKGVQRVSASAPLEGVISTPSRYTKSVVDEQEFLRGTLNRFYDTEARIEFYCKSGPSDYTLPRMKELGWSLLDVTFIKNATAKHPYVNDCVLTFSDDKGLIWKMQHKNLREDFEHGLPILGGVYCIYSEDVLLYLGKSGTLRKRIKDHLSNPEKFFTDECKHKVTSVKVAQVPDSVMHYMEMQLIAEMCPLLNRDSVPLNPLPFEVDVPVFTELSGWETYYNPTDKVFEEKEDMSMEMFEALLKR